MNRTCEMLTFYYHLKVATHVAQEWLPAESFPLSLTAFATSAWSYFSASPELWSSMQGQTTAARPQIFPEQSWHWCRCYVTTYLSGTPGTLFLRDETTQWHLFLPHLLHAKSFVKKLRVLWGCKNTTKDFLVHKPHAVTVSLSSRKMVIEGNTPSTHITLEAWYWRLKQKNWNSMKDEHVFCWFCWCLLFLIYY